MYSDSVVDGVVVTGSGQCIVGSGQCRHCGRCSGQWTVTVQ